MTVMTADLTNDRATARAELDANYTPQYIQVARHVLARIKGGAYPKFSCIPGSQALAAEFGMSKVVVLHGLTVLVRAGYLRHVESKPHQVIWDGQGESLLACRTTPLVGRHGRYAVKRPYYLRPPRVARTIRHESQGMPWTPSSTCP